MNTNLEITLARLARIKISAYRASLALILFRGLVLAAILMGLYKFVRNIWSVNNELHSKTYFRNKVILIKPK